MSAHLDIDLGADPGLPGARGGARVDDRGVDNVQARVLDGLPCQEGGERDRHVVGTSGARVVPGIGDEEGLGPFLGCRQAFLHGGNGCDKLEAIVHVPKILADALGLLLHEIRVVTRDDDRSLAAGLVRPREADPDSRVEDALHLLDGVDHLVEGLGGFDACRGLFAG